MRAWGVEAREPIVADPGALQAEIHSAYRRGRKDERKHRRRSPLVAGSLLAIAAIGVALLYFAVREGSFARGGQVVDAQLNQAVATAPNVVNDAATHTGAALRSAGERIQAQGVRMGADAPPPGPSK
jgi:hypothetical protein